MPANSRWDLIRGFKGLTQFWPLFSGACAKLRKAAISFVMTVRPPVRMEQLGFHWRDFQRIPYLSISRRKRTVAKIQVSLESDNNNNGYSTWRAIYIFLSHLALHFFLYLAQFFWEWEMFQIKFLDEINTHILCSSGKIKANPLQAWALRFKPEGRGFDSRCCHWILSLI